MKQVKCENCGRVLYEVEAKSGHSVVKKICKCGSMNVHIIENGNVEPFQDRIGLRKKSVMP